VLAELPITQVVAICDTVQSAASRLAERFNIRKEYGNLTEMLKNEELDVVDVLTPPETHAPLSVEVLRHGCHCLMEKPLVMTTAEADEVIRVAEETGLALHVTHTFSYFPAIRKAKALVASGAVGEVIGVDIQYLTSVGAERYFSPDHWCHRMPGGIFYDITPHLVMLLLDFLGDINDVKVTTKKLSSYSHIDADELKVMVEAEKGLGSFHLSMNSPLTRYTIAITGTKMSLWVNADAQIVVRHKPVAGYRTVGSFGDAIPRGLGAVSEIWQQAAGLASTAVGVISGRVNYLAGHRYLIEASLRSLRGDGEYPVDLYKCHQVVRVLEMIFGPPTQGSSERGYEAVQA
jgi:predicted dehydrogenase